MGGMIPSKANRPGVPSDQGSVFLIIFSPLYNAQGSRTLLAIQKFSSEISQEIWENRTVRDIQDWEDRVEEAIGDSPN